VDAALLHLTFSIIFHAIFEMASVRGAG